MGLLDFFVSLKAIELFQNKLKPWLKAKVSKEKWKAGHVVSVCLNSKFIPPTPGKVAHTSDLSPGAIVAKRIQGYLWLNGKSEASLGCVSA